MIKFVYLQRTIKCEKSVHDIALMLLLYHRVPPLTYWRTRIFNADMCEFADTVLTIILIRRS